MFSVNLFLQVTFVIVQVAAVIFQDCGSAYRLTTVNIRGCSNRLPCFVTVGENVSVQMDFFADFSSNRLDQDVVMNINFINLRPEVSPEACDASRMCIVRTDDLSSFTSIMSVPGRMALNQRGWLEWRVMNEDQRTVLCFRVLVQTQSQLQAMLREQAVLMRNQPIPTL